MVLLTTTLAAQSAIDLYNELRESAVAQGPNEPSLVEATVGGPVSHSQLIAISQYLQGRGGRLSGGRHGSSGVAAKADDVRLDALLKGSRIWTPPPKPKPEPSSEYVALMARLRVEEEQRAYERMINPLLADELQSQRLPNAMPAFPTKDEDDELVYADVNRQLALIINVLVSIIACSVAIWMAARHWSVPQRLALSLTGSGLVAAAEIVIFSGYIRRVREAKLAERAKLETKEVVETWVIDGKKGTKGLPDGNALRFRKGKHR